MLLSCCAVLIHAFSITLPGKIVCSVFLATAKFRDSDFLPSPPLEKGSSDGKTLPAVRAPVKGPEAPVSPKEKSINNSNSQAAEIWLDEARKEAGISKPFTVSPCKLVSMKGDTPGAVSDAETSYSAGLPSNNLRCPTNI